jgi:hypothetical protein
MLVQVRYADGHVFNHLAEFSYLVHSAEFQAIQIAHARFHASNQSCFASFGGCSPKRTSLAEPRSVSVVLIAVSVWPHLGPGGLPMQGKGLGRGAGSGSVESGSMVLCRPVNTLDFSGSSVPLHHSISVISKSEIKSCSCAC